VATLYRVVLSNHVTQFTSNSLSAPYLSNRVNHLAYGTNALFQRVTDGVVHFQLRAYDADGLAMTWRTNVYPDVVMIRDPRGGPVDVTRATFLADALPGWLELEFGILEPQVVDQLKSMPNPTMAAEFLSRQAGRVHLFQQRIPIRRAP
jgi:hypothetical protein